MGQAGARQLYKILKKSQTLESLSVAGDLTIGNDGVILLAAGIKKNPEGKLRTLNISCKRFMSFLFIVLDTDCTDSAAESIFEAVGDKQGLVVQVKGNGFSKAMIQTLKSHPTIKFEGLDPR